MVNELKNVGEWVKNVIAPTILLQQLPSQAQLDEWRAYIASERKRILENLLATVALMDEPEGKRYIQNNQKNTLILEEVLHDYQFKLEQELPGEVVKLYEYACMELDEVLEEMQRFYYCYFDASLPVSYTLSVKKREALFELHRGINHLVCNSDKDSELWDIVLKPINRFLSDMQRPITFHVIRYYEILLKELSTLAMEDTIRDADSKIHEILLSYNFNDPNYVRHYSGLIATVAGICNQKKDRLEIFLRYRKMIRQQAAVPDAILLLDWKTVTEQLTSWLNAEIEYWEARILIDEPTQLNAAGFLEPAHKLKLGASVSELAVVLKILYQIGAFKKAKFADVLRVFAETFNTTGTEEISVKSLHSKAYSSFKDPVTIKNIRKWLLEYLELLPKQTHSQEHK